MPVSHIYSLLLIDNFLDLEFEGQRVPNLTKVDSKASINEQEVQTDIDKEKDDYVLSKLFKKSGVHSALQHDTIVENSVNDYVFIEAEAHRYAEEAVKALRKSAEDCYSAESGIPNWGAKNIQHFSSRQFGSRTNKDVVVVQDEEQPSSSSSIVRKSITRTSSASNNLLNDIRERKREQSDFVVRTNTEQTENLDEEDNTNAEGLSLIRELKNYLSAGTTIPGKATTAEIIDHFQNRLNGQAGLIPKFKSLLKQIADLQRTPSGMGFWILKEEFRGT
jgi:DNA excision repair protein ERCC-6